MSAIYTLGFRVKTGWAAAVLLGGSGPERRVLDSRVALLADPDVPHARQPYHAAFGTAQVDTSIVTRLVRGVERFSRRSIAALVAELREQHQVRRAAVVVASLTDPASIANQHMRAHASEGRLFRAALVAALERCDVGVRVILERDVYDLLAKVLRRSPSQAKARIAALGETVDRWRAEQKVAAAGAWLVR